MGLWSAMRRSRLRRFIRDDDALVPALAALVLAAMTVAGSATVYVVVRTVAVEGDVPPVLVFSGYGSGCPATFTVMQATELVPYDEVELRPTGGGASHIAVGGHAVRDGVWKDAPQPGSFGPGSRVIAWVADESVSVDVVHTKSGHIIGQIAAPSHEDDSEAPVISLAIPPSFDDELDSVSGDITDPGCSGAAQVAVAIEDLATSRYWTGAAWSDTLHALPATLAMPGERWSGWTLDTSNVPWEAGHTYRFTAAGGDGAGNEGPAATTTSTEGGGGGANQQPVADFTFACSDLDCVFDASTSYDPDGSITAYSWDFGDGNTGSGVAPSHTYAAGGSYTVTLTVSDDDAANGASGETVTPVAPGSAPPPLVGDPGFSYEDIACNFDFDPGVDVDVSAQVQAGLFTTVYCLVITPSEPPVHLSGASQSLLYEAKATYVGTSVTLTGANSDAVLRTTEDGIRIRSTVDLRVSGTNGDLTLDIAGEVVLEDDVGLEVTGNGGQLSIVAGLDVTIGDDASLKAAGTSGDVTISGAAVTLGENGMVHAAGRDGDVDIDATGAVVIGAGTTVKVSGQSGRILVDSGASLTAESVTFAASGKNGLIRLTADGTLWLDGAAFAATGQGAAAEASTSTTSNTLHLDAASVEDSDDTLLVGPSGANVSGTLADGAWSY